MSWGWRRMSSPPAEGSRFKRNRAPFEQWRKVMLLGAVILLINALGNALVRGQLPGWLSLILTFAGYGFLAVGFGMRMREMKAAKEETATSEKEERDEKALEGSVVAAEDQPQDQHRQ